MDEQEAARILGSLDGELREADSQAAYFAGRAASIRKVMEGIRDLFPEVQPDIAASGRGAYVVPLTSQSAPVTSAPELGRDYLRRVMGADPAKWFSATDLLDELHALDVSFKGQNPDAVVRRWLRMAAEKHMVERRQRDGRTFEYRWILPTTSDGPTEAGPSRHLSPVEEGGGSDVASVADE